MIDKYRVVVHGLAHYELSPAKEWDGDDKLVCKATDVERLFKLELLPMARWLIFQIEGRALQTPPLKPSNFLGWDHANKILKDLDGRGDD